MSALAAAFGDWLLAPPVPAAANASAATSTAKMHFFIEVPPSLVLLCRRRFASLVCLGRSRGRVSGRMEDAEHAQRRLAHVLQRVLPERREMDARATGDRRRLDAVAVQDALALEDVHDLVVRMTVHAGTAGRDDADELRHVEAADVLVHEVAELPVRAGRKRRPVLPAHCPLKRGR